jgi:CRP/FNR family transcriptional regulator, cyclic AMP receptor protein
VTQTPHSAGAEPDTAPLVRWPERALALGAQTFGATEGAQMLARLWPAGRLAAPLPADALTRLAGVLQFVSVSAGRVLIQQDEPGDFMLVLLDGNVAVERRFEGSSAAVRLAEARPGDVLGEMALLDAGPRTSECTTRTSCVLAVLEMDALARLMHDDAPLALAVMTSLARRLSLRLRQVGARLTALLSDA